MSKPEGRLYPPSKNAKKITYAISAKELSRLAALAERSGVTLDRWLEGAIASAAANDEAHWREVEEEEAIVRGVDRSQFGRISHHLRNLPSGVTDLLVETVARARMQGRHDAAESGKRLAARRVA